MAARGVPQSGAAYLLAVDGSLLTQARIDSQLSCEAVAHRIGGGIHKSTISRWERGVKNPPLSSLFELVELFGTNDFVRLNEKAVVTEQEKEVIRGLRDGLVVERLNGKAALTAEEIEVVRKLREG